MRSYNETIKNVHLAIFIPRSPGIQSFVMWSAIMINIVQIVDQVKSCMSLSFSRRLPDVTYTSHTS